MSRNLSLDAWQTIDVRRIVLEELARAPAVKWRKIAGSTYGAGRAPVRANPTDSGADVYAAHDFVVRAGESATGWLGIALQLPPGFEAQIRPRSGLASKFSINAHLGTIDEGYRGEIGVIIFNHGAHQRSFTRGERIAQLVVARVWRPEFVEVDTLDNTDRGEGGFGSTGL